MLLYNFVKNNNIEILMKYYFVRICNTFLKIIVKIFKQ